MLSLEYLLNGGLKAWFIDPLGGWGSFETYVLWMSEMFATLLRFSYFLDVLNRKAGLSQNEQVIDIRTSQTAQTSSFCYNTDDITACLLPF